MRTGRARSASTSVPSIRSGNLPLVLQYTEQAFLCHRQLEDVGAERRYRIGQGTARSSRSMFGSANMRRQAVRCRIEFLGRGYDDVKT